MRKIIRKTISYLRQGLHNAGCAFGHAFGFAFAFVFACIFACVTLTSCGSGQDNVPLYEYDVYYLNKENTKVLRVDYESQLENTEENTKVLVRELIYVLSNVAEKPEYVPPISGNVVLLNYTLEDGQLTLDFSELYYKQDKIQEILGRAAIVRTLSQLRGIRTVSFSVLEMPLTDSAGLPVGTMTAESFIDNAGTDINAYEQAQLHLYFANEEGDKLVIVNRKVMYNSNISMEKLVMDELVKGPVTPEGEEPEAYPTINPETVVQGVTVKDGVCYVNLSEAFLTQIYNVTTDVTLYSIANSLAELPNVNKVQISIDGESNMMFRESVNLTTVFERNLDIMEE